MMRCADNDAECIGADYRSLPAELTTENVSATLGRRPMIANSPVPIPKPPQASASCTSAIAIGDGASTTELVSSKIVYGDLAQEALLGIRCLTYGTGGERRNR